MDFHAVVQRYELESFGVTHRESLHFLTDPHYLVASMGKSLCYLDKVDMYCFCISSPKYSARKMNANTEAQLACDSQSIYRKDLHRRPKLARLLSDASL